MSNLISSSAPYLHSTPETFFTHARTEDIGGYRENSNQRARFRAAATLMKAKATAARAKEKAFYGHFRTAGGGAITTAEQWANEFLIRSKDEDRSLVTVVQEIFDSPEMIQQIRATTHIEEAKIRDVINSAQQKNPSNDPVIKAFYKAFEQSTEKNIEKILADAIAASIKTARKGSSGIKDIQVAQKLFSYIYGDLNSQIKQITATGRARNLDKNYGKSIKQMTRAMSRQGASVKQVQDQITTVLTKGLINANRTDDEIKLVLSTWDKIGTFDVTMNTNKINLSPFLSGDNSNIIGGVEEAGRIISMSLVKKYTETSAGLRDNAEIRAHAFGQELVSRLGSSNKVESKTDTIISFCQDTAGSQYRIQEKNSIATIYNDLEVLSKTKNVLQTNFANMTMQRETSLEHFFEIAQALDNSGEALIKEEDIAAISYMLVNYLVLSNPAYERPEWSTTYRGKAKKVYKTQPSDADFYALGTRGIIERLLSLGVLTYFSDIPETITATGEIQTIDFIIFKSRFLIPMSYIYEDIISSLEDMEKFQLGASNMGKKTQLQTSFTFSYSAREIKNMNLQKENFPIKNANYSESSFVNIGKTTGQNVLNRIKINSVQLNIDPQRFLNLESLRF